MKNKLFYLGIFIGLMSLWIPAMPVTAADNPIPVLYSISPASYTAGDPAVSQITIIGNNFVQYSTVIIDGTPQYQTDVHYVSSDKLLFDTLHMQGGFHHVMVSNPVPGGGLSNSLTLTVNSVNMPPFANDGQFTLLQDRADDIGTVLFNLIEDPDEQDTFSFTVGSGPSHGTLSRASGIIGYGINSELIYKPVTGYHGYDSFTFQVYDGNPGHYSNWATMNLWVKTANDAPSFTIGPNQTVPQFSGPQSVSNWATDISPGPYGEDVQSVNFILGNDNPGLFRAQPAVLPSGTLTYIPSDAFGVAHVRIMAHDDGGTANGGTDLSPEQIFTITVIEAVNHPPVAYDDQVTVEIGTMCSFDLNASDLDGNEVIFTVITPPAKGDLVLVKGSYFSYYPFTTYQGSDSFTFNVFDGKEYSNIARVDITNKHEPVAGSDLYATTLEDTPLSITLNATDADNDTLTYIVENPPFWGTLSGNAPNLIYTPPSNFNGDESFILFRVFDGTSYSNYGAIQIKVIPVNDPPSFIKGPDQLVAQDTPECYIPNWATNISAGPANEKSQILDFTLINDNNSLFFEQPKIDQFGTLTYVLASEMHGVANVTVKLHDDGGNSNGGKDTYEQTFTITVTKAVNQPPVAEDGLTISIQMNTPTAIRLFADDFENDPLSYTVVAQPLHGSLTGTVPELTYTPQANFIGLDFFVFKANDGNADSNLGRIEIEVNPIGYTVVASVAGGHGTVRTVNSGISFTIFITPETGYHICSITDNKTPVIIANTYVLSNVSENHEVVVTFGGPKSSKQDVISALNALRVTVTNKDDAGKLDDAIKHLTASLAFSLWVDDAHLQPKDGQKVFIEEKDAVNSLNELVKDKKSSLNSSALQNYISILVEADRQIALAAATGNPDGKESKQAYDEMAKAADELSKGNPSSAIDHYKSAWQHATKT